MNKSKIAKALTAFTIVSVMAYGAFRAVKVEAMKKLPHGITARDVQFTKHEVVFKDVTIERKWMIGSIDEVRVDYGGTNVKGFNGNLSIDLDKKEAGVGASEEVKKTSFEGFNIKIKRGAWNAELKAAHGERNEACFGSASASGNVG